MFGVTFKLFPSRMTKPWLALAGSFLLVALGPAASRAQKSSGLDSEQDMRPAFSDFRGVHIGMPAEEARKKLGNPREKSAEQDFYLFNDSQAVQIFYDKAGTVTAVSIDFMSGANSIPSCKDVLGAEAQAKPDGPVYKLLRYPKAGYWVSYSRTAGNSPTITITMQKIEH